MNLPLSMVKRGIVGGITAVQPVFAGLKIVNGNKLARLGEEVGRLQLQKTESPRCASRPTPITGRSCRCATTFRPSKPWNASWRRFTARSELSVKAGLVTTNDLLRVDCGSRRSRRTA